MDIATLAAKKLKKDGLLPDLDESEEIKELEVELTYLGGFLKSVRGKLSNEKFVAHAPEAVVAAERKKESDAMSKIESIKKSLEILKK